MYEKGWKDKMSVYVLIEEMRGMKRKRKFEDMNILGVYKKESVCLRERDRLHDTSKRMKLDHYVLRIEEHEIDER